MPKFQIVRRLVMQEFDNEADALKELHRLYEIRNIDEKIAIRRFRKERITPK